MPLEPHGYYRKATGEGRESVTAAIFWLKCRAGWREITRHEIDSRSVVQFDRIERVIVSPDPERLARARREEAALRTIDVTPEEGRR
jgi:hypothetical protein